MLLMKKQTQTKDIKSVQVDKRATEMVAQMTLDTKIGQMTQLAKHAGHLPVQQRDSAAGSVKLIEK